MCIGESKDYPNKIKLLILDKFGRDLSGKEIEECYRSLFYLGKAISRFRSLGYEKRRK